MAEDESNQEEELERDPDAEAEELDGEEKGSPKKLLFILIPFLLIGIGGGLFFSGALDSMLGKDKAETAEHSEEGAEKTAEGQYPAEGGEHAGETKGDGKGGFIEVPDLLVNLASSTGQPHFLRLRVKLELHSADDVLAVEAILPRVIDRFQTFLREMRVEDLRGSAGIYRLRQELLFRVNKAAAPVEIKDVLFQEILIQ